MAYETTVFNMSGTGDWSHPDHRPKNYREMAFELFPDSPAVLTYVLSKLPSTSVDDPEYKLYEWRLPKMTCINKGEAAAVAAALDSDTLTLYSTADSATTYAAEGASPAQHFKAGDILRVESGNANEQVVVTAVASATTLTVARYWGSTNTPGTGVIADGAVLRWAGSVYSEGSGAPTALSKRASVVTNYTGIFKDSCEVSGTAEQMRTRPYKPWPQLKGEALERHMLKLEWAILNSVKQEDNTLDADGEYMRSTGGIRYWIDQAQGDVDLSAGVDLDTLEDEMETAFTYGSKEKMGVVGYRALNILNRLVRSNTTWNWNAESLPKKQTYGLEVFQLRSPFGILNLVPHKLLAESATQTKDLFILDTKYIEYVNMRGRDTFFKDNVQDNDADRRKGVYTTECGIRLALPECHAIWTGLNAVV